MNRTKTGGRMGTNKAREKDVKRRRKVDSGQGKGWRRRRRRQRSTHQSVEAQESMANRPFLTLCTVSCGTSGLSRKPITCLMTFASRRISPITTHHSRQPASMNTWSRYLKKTEWTAVTQIWQKRDDSKNNNNNNKDVSSHLTWAAPATCVDLCWPAPWRCAPAQPDSDSEWTSSRPPWSSHRPPLSWSLSGLWLSRCCTLPLQEEEMRAFRWWWLL